MLASPPRCKKSSPHPNSHQNRSSCTLMSPCSRRRCSGNREDKGWNMSHQPWRGMFPQHNQHMSWTTRPPVAMNNEYECNQQELLSKKNQLYMILKILSGCRKYLKSFSSLGCFCLVVARGATRTRSFSARGIRPCSA